MENNMIFNTVPWRNMVQPEIPMCTICGRRNSRFIKSEVTNNVICMNCVVDIIVKFYDNKTKEVKNKDGENFRHPNKKRQ